MSCIPIQDFSLITLCDATKAGKLYSIVPDSGAGDFDVVRASTATYLGSDGLIKTAANNEPRIEFNEDGSYKGLLFESAATNLALRSEEFDDAEWGKSRLTLGSNVFLSGLNFIEQNQESGETLAGVISKTISLSGNNTFSVFAKKNGKNFVVIRTRLSPNRSTWFNLVDGTFQSNTSNHIAQIQDIGNGVYRCIVTDTSASQDRFIISLADENLSTSVIDNQLGILVAGAQLEEGTVATSYIPTVASTVTRAADVINRTNASALIGQTEFSMFFDVDVRLDKGVFVRLANLQSATTADIINFNILSSNVLSFFLRTNFTTRFNLNNFTLPSSGRYKILFTSKSGQHRIFCNGVLVDSGTDTNILTNIQNIALGNTFATGADQLNDHIKAVAILPTAISEQEAINLTS